MYNSHKLKSVSEQNSTIRIKTVDTIVKAPPKAGEGDYQQQLKRIWAQHVSALHKHGSKGVA
jgi:hypothetical protein